MAKYTIVDMKRRRDSFAWFSSFSNPCYGMNVRMDVTKALKLSKELSLSFYICMIYAVNRGLNRVEELRMRIVDDVPVIFDNIDPSYTIATDEGFANVRHEDRQCFSDFYKTAAAAISSAKTGNAVDNVLNDPTYNPADKWDEFYMTCMPWADFSAMTHPIPDDKRSQSVPRVCWGKYAEEDGRFLLTLNITVSHALCDGRPLAQAFEEVQKELFNADNWLK